MSNRAPFGHGAVTARFMMVRTFPLIFQVSADATTLKQREGR